MDSEKKDFLTQIDKDFNKKKDCETELYHLFILFFAAILLTMISISYLFFFPEATKVDNAFSLFILSLSFCVYGVIIYIIKTKIMIEKKYGIFPEEKILSITKENFTIEEIKEYQSISSECFYVEILKKIKD